jgi:hypothetical protein
MCPSFGKIALQLLVARFGREMTPSAPEWHCSFTLAGIPASEASSAGSPNPFRAPSCGSSRKIARGLGRCSDRCRFARLAVMMPPNEKPK